tara:strand:+ start:932 stop:1339 length:408 start_codon:yes stop_codon:yes gene_type:complete
MIISRNFILADMKRNKESTIDKSKHLLIRSLNTVTAARKYGKLVQHISLKKESFTMTSQVLEKSEKTAINVIKYLGIPNEKCECCSSYIPKHSYKWDLLFKKLYPKDYKTSMIVCEKCAMREVGKKNWNKTKRSG